MWFHLTKRHGVLAAASSLTVLCGFLNVEVFVAAGPVAMLQWTKQLLSTSVVTSGGTKLVEDPLKRP